MGRTERTRDTGLCDKHQVAGPFKIQNEMLDP
jgi:hypothetical protein